MYVYFKPAARLVLSYLTISALLLPSFLLYAQSPDRQLDDLAQRLIEVRADVEELQSELDIQREEHKGRMAFLSVQVTELESNQEREQLRVQQLQQELEDLRVKAEAAGAGADSLLPSVLSTVSQLRTVVESSIPFKLEERLKILDEVVRETEAGVSTPQRSLNRLWAFIEDELRISKENAIYSQTIQINGASVLADVAKLGTVALYFRTRDNQVGFAHSTNSGWQWVIADEVVDQEQITALFDALRKQIRQGYFELPNALPALTQS